MSSTFTTNKNFEKQGSGDHSGTWDGNLNANFDILEAALSGIKAVSLGSTTVALTQADCQNSVISCTGTLTANVIVTIPNISGNWIVVNGTSGAFSVTLKNASGGSTVIIPQGSSSIVYSNGTSCALGNSYAATAGSATSATSSSSAAIAAGLGDGNGNGHAFYAYGTLGYVLQSATGQANVQMPINTNGGGTTIGYLYGQGGGNVLGLLNGGGGWMHYADQSGNFVATGNVAAYSDARLKSNIRTIDNATNLIEQMRGVRFTKDGVESVGVIAQEMQSVLPEVVQEGGEYLAVSYGNIVGVLIEAVKDLSARVRELEAK